MASDKQYLQYVLEQLSPLDGVAYRSMMGEFVLYYRGKVVGGIYDDRVLLKPTPAAVALSAQPRYESPYQGAKPMLAVDVENRDLLVQSVLAVFADLS